MPLDGHSYLISQGWSGHGTGLREDSIVRPLAIPQKRTLTGLGKDRDEAFPFWDHLFSVAAKTIQVKLAIDDEDDSDVDVDSPGKSTTTSNLDRTTTGILSNKPPKRGTPASGSATPTTSSIPVFTVPSSRNLLVAAKREAAKRSLYARFFRGPILGPDPSDTDFGPSFSSLNANSGLDGPSSSTQNGLHHANTRTPMAIAKAKIITANDAAIPVVSDPKTRKKKRKWETPAEEGTEVEEVKAKAKENESREERRERKEMERQEKAQKKHRKGMKERKREKEKEKEKEGKGKDEQVLVKEAHEPGVNKSKKRKRSEDKPTQAGSTTDSDLQTAEIRPAIDLPMGEENQKESMDQMRKRSKIKIRETKCEEDGRERRKAKKLDPVINTTGLAVAIPDSSSQNDADVDMAIASSSTNSDSTPETEVLKKKRKKKRKTVK